MNVTWCLGFFINEIWELILPAAGGRGLGQFCKNGVGQCVFCQGHGGNLILLGLADGILRLYWLCTYLKMHHAAF